MRFTTAPMTPIEAGRFLRQVAEMTASNSQNWDNCEAIAADLIKSAYDAGKHDTIEACANIAEAIDSERGNEKQIALAIRALAVSRPHQSTPEMK